ncbi:MAG: gamma-glutamyl-gamma-aminobutyrate hydrolase [Rouxiella aceris]|uniref:gamma-glutamyl-gamma-aminobutyrate hydrolase n=1 Tax=Rouxiella aceris TaxID=2703884 RepID=UPI00284F1CD1|nr:gamma-glutamyl-gamma-aminobutyrate hydrolase [Rouxiella aceris]MDR3431001.1 gamma-glutamyl-gamma-aminobutyrate hydrolase [Rouxiella aceris]
MDSFSSTSRSSKPRNASSVAYRPIIGVVMCENSIDDNPALTVHEKYLDAIFHANGLPVALPHELATKEGAIDSVLSRLDGIFLTGSPSNIEPHLYGEEGIEELADPGRDKLSMALIKATLAQGIPLFAACRGMQELVVATGGSLFRKVQEQPGYMDHREDTTLPHDRQYDLVHPVAVIPGGLLSELLPGYQHFQVNSLHGQGANRLGAELTVEAVAPDNLVEAVSIRQHPFALGVQWHPEWHSMTDPVSKKLFDAFISACRQYHYQQQMP